jgi:hypothetical protein
MLLRNDRWTKLQSIVTALELESDAFLLVSASRNNFSLRLLNHANIFIPEKPQLIEHITNQYDRLVDIDSRRSVAIRRCADDLRDILERKVVIDRYTSQYQESQKDYDRKKVISLKSKGKPEEFEARANATAALYLAQSTLKKLIDQIEKFSLFTERRIKHAFRVYGDTLSFGNEAEESVLVALMSELSAFYQS